MKVLVVILSCLLPFTSWAEDIGIIDVRRNIPLSDDEPVYKDFYLNVDPGSSLKKNLVVTAVRKVAIRDSSGAQSYGEIEIPVGQLKIIALSGRIAVAREYKLHSRDDLPMLEQVGLMIGDRIDLEGSFVDNKSLKKRQTSSLPPPPPTAEVQATATSPVPAPPTASPVAPVVPAAMTPAPPPQADPTTASAENSARSPSAQTN